MDKDINMDAVAREGWSRLTGTDNRNEFQKHRDKSEYDKCNKEMDEAMQNIETFWSQLPPHLKVRGL